MVAQLKNSISNPRKHRANVPRRLHLISSALLGLIGFSFASNAQIELPEASESQTELVLYLPVLSAAYPRLNDKLDGALAAEGVPNVTVKNVDFWHPYQHGLRQGRIGVYFAQPHFAAWAIHQHGFIPLLKLHGRLKYVLATERDKQYLFEVSDLAGQNVCREAGLNLGTVWLNRLLGEHRITASSSELPSVEQNMLKQAVDCDAFVIQEIAYQRVNKDQKQRFIRLAQSPEYKHNVFVAHPKIARAQLKKLYKALKSKAATKVLMPYLRDLSQWQNLLPVKAKDYPANDSELLHTYWANKTSEQN